MDDVKRKVYLDLFASPETLLPIVGGLTALLASWAMGGNAWLTFGGLAGVLGGVGMFASRVIFGLEKLTNRAYQYVVQQQQTRQVESLQALHKKLQKDQDQRTHRLLQQLWELYKGLQKDIRAGKISLAAHDVLDSVDRMFHVCVDYLDRSYELWRTAQRLEGNSRRQLLEQREELVAEVAQATEYLSTKVQQLNEVTNQRNKSELAQLRAELDESIRVARLAEERTAELGNTDRGYSVSEFE